MTDDWSAWDGDPDDTADLGGDDGAPDLDGTDEGAAGFGPADAHVGDTADAGYGAEGDPAGADAAGDPAPDPADDPTGAYGVDPYGDDGGAEPDGAADPDAGGDGVPDPDAGGDGGGEPAGEAAMGPADVAGPVGADPDVDPYADGGWPAPAFPEAIDVGPPPEPVDGFPWVDPATLGDPAALADDPTPTGAAEPADLAEYAAADPGTPLATSDDPATAALARFWNLS